MSSSDCKRMLTISAVAVWLGAVPFFHVSPAHAANQATRDIIRRSDIDMVSWYPPGQHTVNPDDFHKWGTTLVTWGLDSIFSRTQNVPQTLRELIKTAHDGGVRSYLANLDMCSAQPWNLAKDEKLREAVARDFQGNGLVVPWFPVVVNDVPAYWACLNHPVYQENVRQRVRDGAAAGCTGLHVDCANMMTGILGRYGGCYCQYCVEGFKKHVRQKYSRQQLSEMGIDDIDAWDFTAEVKRVIGMYRAAESLGKMLSVTTDTMQDWPYPAKGGMSGRGVSLRSEEKEVFQPLKREGRAAAWTRPESALRGIEPLVRVAEGKRSSFGVQRRRTQHAVRSTPPYYCCAMPFEPLAYWPHTRRCRNRLMCWLNFRTGPCRHRLFALPRP